jgi:hypothetical protein
MPWRSQENDITYLLNRGVLVEEEIPEVSFVPPSEAWEKMRVWILAYRLIFPPSF